MHNLRIGRKTSLLWQKEESWACEHSGALLPFSLIHPTLPDIEKICDASMVGHLDKEERKTRKVLAKVLPFLLT